MRASENGHVETVRLLLDRGADINAEDYVSTCECTGVSVCLVCVSVCLCLVLLVCKLLLSITMCTFRSAVIAIVLIPVMVGRVIERMHCSYEGL